MESHCVIILCELSDSVEVGVLVVRVELLTGSVWCRTK